MEKFSRGMDDLLKELYHKLQAGDKDAERVPLGHGNNDVEDMASRVNLQVLGECIRSGGGLLSISRKPPYERLQEANGKMSSGVKALAGEDLAKKLDAVVSEYESTLIDVYFSLGMKAGARLNHILMGDFNRDA